jgi:hypothetical protein
MKIARSETIPRACYCDHCLSDFYKKKGVSLPDTLESVMEKANHLLTYHDATWNHYRIELVATMLQEIVNAAKQIQPGIKISIHAVPWRKMDFNDAGKRVAGQDLTNLAAFTDYVSPMCYSAMLRRDPKWISSVVKDLNSRAPGKILPSIQVYDEADSATFDRKNFAACIREAMEKPSLGVVFWSWPLFEKDPARMKIAKAAVGN